MGVYGSFLSAFPELHFNVHFKDGRKIRGVLTHTVKSETRRENNLNVNNVLVHLYVRTGIAKGINIGDRFEHPEYGYEMRVLGMVPYNQSAGYTDFLCERVTGPESTQTEELRVKEAEFD